MSSEYLNVDVDELASAATNLESIARRLEAAVIRLRPAVDVAAPARDEVSTAAARAAGEVGALFAADAESGVGELRTVAAVLHAQIAAIETAEDAGAAGLRTGTPA